MVPPPVEDDDVHVDEDEDKHSNNDARLIHINRLFFMKSKILDRRRRTRLRGRWWRGCATGRFGSSNPEYSNKAQCTNIDGWGWNFGFTFRKFLEVIWRYQLFRMLIPTHSWFTIRANKDYYCLAGESDAGHFEERHRCIHLETRSWKSYSIVEDYSTTGCKGLMRWQNKRSKLNNRTGDFTWNKWIKWARRWHRSSRNWTLSWKMWDY